MIVQDGDPKTQVNEPLERKTLERIERLSGQQIAELKPKYMQALTHNFDERYARLVMSKGQSTADQQTLFDAMSNCYKVLYSNIDSFGNEYLEEPMPSWFDEWDNALAFGELIQEERPSQQLIQQAVSIPVLLDEEGMLKHWMTMSMQILSATLKEAMNGAQGITEQIRSMRDGSITRLLKRVEDMDGQLKEFQTRCQQLTEDNNRLKAWYESWQRLRDNVAHAIYDPSDIAEAGGVDNPSVMEDVIGAIMTNYDLEKENEKLRTQQEAWRESEEYKAERSRWEKKTQQRIDVQELKQRLLAHAKTYSETSSEQLRSLVLNLNAILQGTPWETVSPTILAETMAMINKNPLIGGDYVAGNKSVNKEVNGVAPGGIGININKDDK